MKKSIIPAILAASIASFTSNGKSLYGFQDGQWIASASSQSPFFLGIFSGIITDGGIDKLCAFAAYSGGQVAFVPRSKLTDQNVFAYDSRLGGYFEEPLPSNLKTVTSGDYVFIQGWTVDNIPMAAYSTLARGMYWYPTTGGFAVLAYKVSVPQSVSPLAKTDAVPAVPLTIKSNDTSLLPPGTTGSGTKTGWASLPMWEKAVIVILALIILYFLVSKVAF